MNLKSTLLLLIVLLAVIAALVITRGRQVIAPSQDTRPGSALFTGNQFPVESVTQVRLQFADGTLVEAQKQDGEWWQLQPVRFPLNQWSLREVLDSFASLRSLESFQPAQSGNPTLEDAGLAPPRVILEVGGSRDGKQFQQTLRLGRSMSGRTYLQVDDRLQVFVASGALTDSLTRDALLQWRRTTLPAPSGSSAEHLVLETPKQKIEVTKSEGRWQIERPLPARADAQVVDSLAAAISRLTIRQFVTDAPADLSVYGLRQPTAKLEVFSAAPAPPPSPVSASQPAATQPTTSSLSAASQPSTEPATPPQLRQTLTVGAPADMQGDTYFATWSDSRDPGNVVFTIPQQDVARLQVTLDSLRDPRVTPIAASDVKEIRIDRPGAGSLTLHRTTEGWDFGMTDLGFLPDKDLADQLVTTVTSARAKSYQSQPPPQPPTVVVTIQTITGAAPEVLRVWQLEPPAATQPVASLPNWLIVRQQEEAAYVVPAEELLGLLQPPLALRQRTVLDIKPSQVTALTLTQPAGATYQLNRARPATEPSQTQPSAVSPVPGTWLLAGQGKLDEQALTQLLRAALPLRAVRWLEGPPPQEPLVRLTLRVDDGREYELVFESATHRAAFGPSGSLGQPFEISSALAQAAQTELRDTTILTAGVEDVASISITDAGQPPITLRRDAQGQYLSSAAGQLNAQAVEQIFRTLAGLRVAHYLDKAPDPTPPAGRAVELALVSGRTLRLVLPAPANPPSSGAAEPSSRGEDSPVLLDDRWVLLDPQTFSILTASPLAADPATPGE